MEGRDNKSLKKMILMLLKISKEADKTMVYSSSLEGMISASVPKF
jgi:hypothetical protein